jgi:hypothetical protein
MPSRVALVLMSILALPSAVLPGGASAQQVQVITVPPGDAVVIPPRGVQVPRTTRPAPLQTRVPAPPRRVPPREQPASDLTPLAAPLPALLPLAAAAGLAALFGGGGIGGGGGGSAAGVGTTGAVATVRTR